jgi:hypothetical protein
MERGQRPPSREPFGRNRRRGELRTRLRTASRLISAVDSHSIIAKPLSCLPGYSFAPTRRVRSILEWMEDKVSPSG